MSHRLVAVAIAVVAITIPLVSAAAASQDWWFLGVSAAPQPVTDVTVVRTGSWDGKPWELTAYVSATVGLCFALTPTAAARRGEGASLGCVLVEGVPGTPEPKPYTPLRITLLAGSSIGFPAHIVGPVVEEADEVAIHLDDGTILRTPTFDAPDELGPIRFYATQLPEPVQRPGVLPPSMGLRKVVGLTGEGEVVACLAVDGAPPTACG